MLETLPKEVGPVLEGLVSAAKEALGGQLVSVVLYGSAAEGRLRSSSDVNLIVVLREFDAAKMDSLRERFRLAHAAVRLNAMFLLESEVAAAAEAFAVKFSDVLARHKVLHGEDPFARLEVSRSATLHRLRQVLVNLSLRLRERYVFVSLREEQLVAILADTTGPLRAGAATILGLEGRSGVPPKEALAELCRSIPGSWAPLLATLSRARESQVLAPGEAGPALLSLMQLTVLLQERARALS